eukprot:1186394-Prorocentrum_minimum.AAC.1
MLSGAERARREDAPEGATKTEADGNSEEENTESEETTQKRGKPKIGKLMLKSHPNEWLAASATPNTALSGCTVLHLCRCECSSECTPWDLMRLAREAANVPPICSECTPYMRRMYPLYPPYRGPDEAGAGGGEGTP